MWEDWLHRAWHLAWEADGQWLISNYALHCGWLETALLFPNLNWEWERRKSFGGRCKVWLPGKLSVWLQSWCWQLIPAGPSCPGSSPGTAGRVLWELGMSAFLSHHCSLLPALHKEGFALGQADMLLSLHELLTHTLWPIPLGGVKGAQWQEIQCSNSHQQCQAVWPPWLGLLYSCQGEQLQHIKKSCDAVSELAESCTIEADPNCGVLGKKANQTQNPIIICLKLIKIPHSNLGH